MKKNRFLSSIVFPICSISLLSCNLSNSSNSTVSVNNHNIYIYNSPNIKNPKALNIFDLGLKLVEQDSLNQAKKDFYIANELEPNNSIIITSLGNIQDKLGEIDSAIYYYKLSLKIDSTNINTYVNYGCVLNSNNRYQEALDIFFKELKMEYDSTSEYALYLNIAASYHYLKNCDKVKQYTDTARLLSQNQTDAIKKEVNDYADNLIKLCQ